jgi:hypothetical protein
MLVQDAVDRGGSVALTVDSVCFDRIICSVKVCTLHIIHNVSGTGSLDPDPDLKLLGKSGSGFRSRV